MSSAAELKIEAVKIAADMHKNTDIINILRDAQLISDFIFSRKPDHATDR
jgi:hypothetical protein